MSIPRGDRLPDEVCARLTDAAGSYSDRAIVICSIDDRGWPHPAMLNARELLVIDAQTLSLTTYLSSRSAANLRANGQVTVILADHDGVHYIKGMAAPLPADGARPGLALFTVRVIEVLEDTAPADEHAHIVTGIRFRQGH